MFKSYFKTAWQNLSRHKLFSCINLFGLAFGIAAVFLIGIYIQNELSYDNFHGNNKNLFRVGYEFISDGKSLGTGAVFTPPFGPDAKNEFPEIESFCRISPDHDAFIVKDVNNLKSSGICFADSSFFKLFSFHLISGNPDDVLKKPYSIVLTSSLAKKLFSGENAAGKTIRLDDKNDYMVTGISADPPVNSQISYEALVSFSTLYENPETNFMDWNGGNQYITYLKLYRPENSVSLEKKLPAFMWKHINSLYEKSGMKINASLQPFRDVHLKYESDSVNTRTNLYVFSFIAILILIISCVNYVNLTTARSSSRFKEIGIRKSLGALRGHLIVQFLGESLLITLGSFILSILMVYLFMPAYSRLIGKPLTLFTGDISFFAILAISIVLIIGAGAGSYLAFYLSSLNVNKTFKASVPESRHSGFRKGLIVSQFAITTALMTCTLVVYLQLNYAKNKSLGFDKDHIIALTLTGDKTKNASSVLKQKIEGFAGVESVTGLSEVPHNNITTNGFVPEGSSNTMVIHQLDADEDFLKTFHLKLISGNYFSPDRPSEKSGYIINETLAKTLGWNNPIGKTISRNGQHKVIGVVNDFIFASLHDKIEPLIISNQPWQNRFDYLAIRYKSGDPSSLLKQIKNTWQNTVNSAPFEYWFLDEAFDKLYKNEEKFRGIFFYFSILSILLSLAGIFGMVSLTIQQRTKEIGIRKVLGAGVSDIVKLTTRSYLILILIASAISIPFAFYYMNAWLQDFAYRINLSWWMFMVSGITTMVIALITIGLQTIKAAQLNPVRSLRTE